MKFRHHPFLALAAALAAGGTLQAATLYWDGTDTTADADGGNGIWNTEPSNTSWNDAATSGLAVPWPATSSGDDDADFGGLAGSVEIAAGGVTVNDILFSTAGYTLTGGPLTLAGALPAITNAGAAAISANLLGTAGLEKTGNGTLTLSGDNSGLSGALVISGATSGNNGGVILTSDSAAGGITSIDIRNNSYLRLNGTTLGEAVAITVAGGGGTSAPEGAVRGGAGVSAVNGPITLANGSVRIGNAGGTLTTFNGAITAAEGSGFGVMFRYSNNQGTILTNPNNYWEGETLLSSGSVYFQPGALPSATNLVLAASASSWFETNGSFTRAAGTGAGQIRFNATAGRVNGLSARGGDLQVNLGGNEIEPATLLWGLDGFTPAILGLAAANATGTLTLLNPIDLNGANRTIDAQNGGADVDAVIAAQLSGAAGSALTKTGGGVIELVTANNYPGGTTVAQSQGVVNPLRVSHSNALGTGSLTIGGGGNNDQARVELVGGITVTNSIPALTSRNNDMPNFFNVAGENTITSNVSSGGGGSRVTFHSDAGNLIFTGNIATRQLNLRGEGNGELRGNVPLSTGYGINKAGGGTWILSGNASYPGTTIISGGTLQIGKGATTGTLPAGNVTNDATLVFDRDGTLTVGAAISGGGELVKRGPGAVTLTAGMHDYSGRTLIEDGALVINGDAGGANVEVLVGNGSGDPASAMLGGGGVIGGDIAIASDGAIAPGSQIGDLLVLGDVAGTGSLKVEIDGDNADSLTLEGGTLTISGLTLSVSRLAAPTQAVYVIVDADSPITGAEFAAVQGLPSGYSVVYNYNYGGDSHNIAITGTPVSDPYENWATVTSGLAGDDALPGADPDHDGLSNLIEFVLGGQPNPAEPDAASNDLAPTVTADSAKLVFTYRRTALSATQPGLKVTVDYGSDLTGWTTAVDGVDGVTITTTVNGFGDGVDRIDVAIPRALASGGKLFARLRAEITP